MINNKQIIEWNSNYPFDRWWRKKHGISFGSKAHLEQCQLDIKFEWLEDKLFNEISVPSQYKAGDWLTPQVVQSEDELYNNVDLSELEVPE